MKSGISQTKNDMNNRKDCLKLYPENSYSSFTATNMNLKNMLKSVYVRGGFENDYLWF